MRSLWKGSISFGLVNIPVRLYTATEEKSVRFNLLHRVCRTPIKYQKVCPRCDTEVSQDELVRGYEVDRGRYILVEDEELESLPLATSRQVEIVDFVELTEIDPIYYNRSYYLEPDEGAQKPYALLRRAMAETGKIAIAKVAIRQKESLACVRVGRDSALVMETMFFPDEIRSAERLAGIPAEVDVGERELAMAIQLVENLTQPFDPAKYEDEYRKALLELIEAKVEGEEVEPLAPVSRAGKVIDLMEALEASLRATAGKAAEGASLNGAERPLRREPQTKREKAKAKRKKEPATS